VVAMLNRAVLIVSGLNFEEPPHNLRSTLIPVRRTDAGTLPVVLVTRGILLRATKVISLLIVILGFKFYS
jgi:hypothetical protein